jgi:hypothetical protein
VEQDNYLEDLFKSIEFPDVDISYLEENVKIEELLSVNAVKQRDKN